MPHVKDAKHHSKKHQQHDQGEPIPHRASAEPAEEVKPRRRPGRDEPEASDADVKVVDVESGHQHEAAGGTGHSGGDSHGSGHDEETKKIEIHFFGSEVLRARFPQPFDVAEAVATDWMSGGSFDHLPIKQPLAQYAAQKGLQQAKELEKKVLESPVTEKIAMQVLTAGFKAQGFIEQLRSKLNSKKKDSSVD